MMCRATSIAAAFFFLFVLSCSSERPPETAKQEPSQSGTMKGSDVAPSATESKESYSLKITPENPDRSSTVYLTPQGFNQGDAKIEWLVNGRLAESSTPGQFKPIEARKGDTVQARATIKDREILSNIVEIKNGPPEIVSARILPEGKQGGSLSAEVSANDIDGDTVTFQYEWTKNGGPAGKEQRLNGPFKRGDKISVKITPFDGEAYGNPVTLQREIANMPPVITDDRKVAFDGKIYTYQIRAVDPDGDPLTYSLKAAPKGMDINPTTGLIKWNVPQDFVGKVPVTVVVSDGHGGDVQYDFKAVINLEK